MKEYYTGASLDIEVRDAKTGEAIACRLGLRRRDGVFISPADTGEKPLWFVHRQCAQRIWQADGIREVKSLFLPGGKAVIPVPPGELDVYIARGMEYEMKMLHLSAKPGETVHLRESLSRTWDPSAEGWWSGDLHVHLQRNSQHDDAFILDLLRCEGLGFINDMVFRHGGPQLACPQPAMGIHGVHGAGQGQHRHVILPGEEFRDNNCYGHTILFGTDRVIEPVSLGAILGQCPSFPFLTDIVDRTEEAGGVFGYAHGAMGGFAGGCVSFEVLPIVAALRRVTFVESVQFNSFLGFYFWYSLLNCGIPMSCTGGSDYPWGVYPAPWIPTLGIDRTYIPFCQEGKNDELRSWTEALRQGTTFATNGPFVFLSVNGKGPGSRLELNDLRGRALISARVLSSEPLECLEVVANGAPVFVKHGGGGRRELVIEEYYTPPGPVWLAARARGVVAREKTGGAIDRFLHGHTSPVYICAQGRLPVVPSAAAWMADYCRYVESHLVNFRQSSFSGTEQLEIVRNFCRQAADFYDRRAAGKDSMK